MKLFNNNIVPYASAEGDKIYPIVVDIKKGIKSGEAISFVTADNQVGVITVDFMDGNSSYSIEGCMVTSTIRRPDGTVLEIPCDIISQSTIEIPLGINGTYQEGVHTFDLKIVRGNGKIIGVPTMSYSVSGSLSSDDVVEGDDRLPVLTMVLDNAQDKLTRLDRAIAGATNDLEVKEARDGEVTLNARLERDLAKGKVHFVDIEDVNISTDSEEGYLENVEIYGNTWQDANNLSDIRSVGTKVEGQELYKIDVVSRGKNLLNGKLLTMSNNTEFRYEADVRGIKQGLYTLSRDSAKIIYLKQYDISNKLISDVQINSLKYVIDIKPGVVKIAINMYVTKEWTYELALAENYQLEEGTKATPYEPYQEDKLTIFSPVQLEKVGNVADRIICKDGVWGVEKNVGTVVLNGSNDWYQVTNKPTTAIPEYRLERGITNYYLKNQNDSCKVNAISNKYNLLGSQNNIWVSTVEGFGVGSYNYYGTIYVSSTYTTLTEFKENLGDLIIKYQLAEPTFIPLPHDQQIKLRTFADRTHIHFETEIEPTIKAQVPKSLGATVNTHTTQIDNLNKELDRVKKLEESTVTTITTDKAFTTVAETTQGYFEDVKVEGKTLVNELGTLGSSIVQNFPDNKPIVWDKNNIKLNTFYTLVVDCKTNSASANIKLSGYELSQSNNATLMSGSFIHDSVIFKAGEIGRYITKVGYTSLDLTKHSPRVTLFNGGSGTVKYDVMLLEGDHTDKDISYFEGLKSVGQDIDEISVLSTDSYVKVLDENDIPQAVRSQTKFEIYEGRRVYSSNHNVMTTFDFNGNVYSTGYVYCDIDGKSDNIRFDVKFEGTRDILIHFRDKDKNTINGEGAIHLAKFSCDNKWTTIYAKLPKGTKYYNIRLAHLSSDAKKAYLDLDSIKVSNNVSKELKQDKKQVLYYNPTTQTWEKPVLREWDSIEKHSDGKYYYHKRSGEVMLDGSESGWECKNTTETNNTFMLNNNTVSDAYYNSLCICDKFTQDMTSGMIKKDNCMRITEYSGMQRVFLVPTIDKCNSTTTFKAWLQANPTTVVYKLAEEEVYECANLDLITYNGETNLIVNSGAIQPRITLKVLSNVSNVVKLLQEKVAILENKFIEGLKQVLAGDMYSLAHLLYPEDFENNHEIQTLEL